MENSTSPHKPTKKTEIKQNGTGLRALQGLSFLIWSVVGVMVLTLLSIAVFGEGTWVENLNITDTTVQEQPAAQQSPAAAQPPQPTEAQLNCVSEELGEERFAELQQGAQPEDDEATIIQECLTTDQ